MVAMSKEAPSPQAPSLFERILAFATVTIIAGALLSFFATLIAGLISGSSLASGLWPFVYAFSIYGLPVGFALLIILLIVSQARRKAEFKRNANKS